MTRLEKRTKECNGCDIQNPPREVGINNFDGSKIAGVYPVNDEDEGYEVFLLHLGRGNFG
jgi:hypothetical protein